MKKTIFTIAIFILGFSASMAKAQAEIKINENHSNSIVFTKVNSFCKLIQIGDYDAVKALIERGENVNKKSTGLTPLMFAARHNKAKIAALLIKHGAKLNLRSDRGGFKALKIAKLSKAKKAYMVIKKAMDK